ncbi:MAG: translation initiation factor IF-3 [Rickettsiales bacterium]|jgi:translation initiation factor IF-3|nr:translation initiation factor IF-3 [Rickettsiales bacterium]
MEITIRPNDYNNKNRDTGPRVNNRIFAKAVQLIGADGQNIGVVPTAQALQMAIDADMDLVEIAGAQTPPVAKIMDFGKYKYEMKKKASEAKKNQKKTEQKEVWVKPFIDDNDLNVKVKKVLEFLNDGDKVKISAMTRGNKRVLARGRDAIPEMFEKIMAMVGDKGTVESRSKPEDRTKSIIIAPK